MTVARDLRLQRLAEHLHRLGPRPVYELLREVRDGADLGDRLERYARLDPAVVRAIGADEMPPRPLAVVPRRTAA